jgi:hypothetical protein
MIGDACGVVQIRADPSALVLREIGGYHTDRSKPPHLGLCAKPQVSGGIGLPVTITIL